MEFFRFTVSLLPLTDRAQVSISRSTRLRNRPYDNHGSEHFLITWNALGRHRRESRSSLEAAKLRAGEVATSISNGQIEALERTGSDRDSYAHAVRLLIPLKMPLHAAIQEFVEARNIAKGVSSLKPRATTPKGIPSESARGPSRKC